MTNDDEKAVDMQPDNPTNWDEKMLLLHINRLKERRQNLSNQLDELTGYLAACESELEARKLKAKEATK